MFEVDIKRKKGWGTYLEIKSSDGGVFEIGTLNLEEDGVGTIQELLVWINTKVK